MDPVTIGIIRGVFRVGMYLWGRHDRAQREERERTTSRERRARSVPPTAALPGARSWAQTLAARLDAEAAAKDDLDCALPMERDAPRAVPADEKAAPSAAVAVEHKRTEYLGHTFVHGTCLYCPLSEKAVRHFAWKCSSLVTGTSRTWQEEQDERQRQRDAERHRAREEQRLREVRANEEASWVGRVVILTAVDTGETLACRVQRLPEIARGEGASVQQRSEPRLDFSNWVEDEQTELVSVSSPLGQALLFKTAGDEITVYSPGGQYQYRIHRIE